MSYFFIPFKNYFKKIGGPATFMANLRDYLISNGFKFNSDIRKIKESSGIFFPISYDKYILSIFKKNNLPIIQRLDGVYYPSKHGDEYIQLNKDIKDIYLNYATHIIFQSNYCKKQVFKMFGRLQDYKYSIIYNGANHNIFYPLSNRISKSKKIIKIITTGNFRNIDMIEPIIIALDKLSNIYNFRFIIIGPCNNKNILNFFRRNYIKYISRKNSKTIAGYIRLSDIFIYSHLNPPCPNSVIEAISCGIPVVGFNSGSMSELLYFSKDLLAPVSNRIIHEYKEFNPMALKDKIEYAFNNLDKIKKRAQKNSHLYSFEETGRQYIKLFNKLLNNS